MDISSKMKHIRKSTGNYICTSCHKPIYCGEDYTDISYFVIFKGRQRWYHERYHLKCYKLNSSLEPVKPERKETVIDRIVTKLQNEGPFPLSFGGEKVWITGVCFKQNGQPFIICRTWETKTVYYETPERINKYYFDEDGNRL